MVLADRDDPDTIEVWSSSMARREHPLITLDRDAAEALFGRRPGRPTISRVVGRAISRTTGMTVSDGTTLFHGALIFGALFYFGRR